MSYSKYGYNVSIYTCAETRHFVVSGSEHDVKKWGIALNEENASCSDWFELFPLGSHADAPNGTELFVRVMHYYR